MQDNLNPSISERDAIEMLSQHLITKPVFDALFEGYSFSDHNPVSQVMQRMIDALEGQHLEKETERLEKFYDSVRTRAAGITDAAAKQTIVKELYEKFFKTAFSGTSDRLGIVYTPNEIVDFILHSVDDALKAEFGVSISDEGVHVLDPFTGTGTFIVRLLQSGLIKPEDLARKYRYELHANEIVLLAYYVAAINIEETYHDLAGGEYEPFTGIVLTDTFQMNEADDQMDGLGVFPENNQRVEAQKALDIQVVLGNPPYRGKQKTANETNQNLKYPTLDARIRETYVAESRVTNKMGLYDAYIRALRWASDRIGERGVVAFVSNGSFIDTPSMDGVRKSIAREFSSISIYNLRGNQRGDWRKEGGKVFGEGSQSTIAVYVLVKAPNRGTVIRYFEVADGLSREEKLLGLATAGSTESVSWNLVEPNAHGDWINQRSGEFGSLTALASKEASDPLSLRVLRDYTRGLATARDAWVYNFSKSALNATLDRMVDFYNSQVAEAERARSVGAAWERDGDAKKISWNQGDSRNLARGISIDRASLSPQVGTYRPFSKTWVAFDRAINDSVYLLPRAFPTPEERNWGFYAPGLGSTKPFSVLAVEFVPDLNLWGSEGGQFFPRYTYEKRAEDDSLFAALEDGDGVYRRIDNVTDEILADYQKTFGPEVTKDEIFFYVYGILHSPDYREQFAADLKKMLPRIPKVKDFGTFADAGRRLAELHLDYETVEPYPVTETIAPGASLRVEKMRYLKRGRETDKTTIVYNSGITVSGLPLEAQEYMLGSRSALDWIIERYQVKTDKASGIVNDPNDWADEQGNPRYILDLIARITTVSVETVKIVNSLPALDITE